MNIASVLHRPMSEFACALSENKYVFRLRALKDDLSYVNFGYADRAAMTPKLSFDVLPMTKISSDKYYDWFEITLETEFERVAYYFEISDGKEIKYYLGECFEDTPDVERSDYFQLPFNHKADRIEVPEWVKEAVVYNIFPDSFASDRREILCKPTRQTYDGVECQSLLGGTVRGITQNLDYIKELGFNCIYLNPFFVADSYHKYDLVDYYHVDPTRGSDNDFKELVTKAHEMGIRVIIDGVFNHISSNHPFFVDVKKNGTKSKYYDCFYDLGDGSLSFPTEGEKPSYTCFAYVPQMPKTNTSNEFLKDYFCKVGEHWIKEYDVDGWRLDVANELDDGFLRAFRSTVKAAKSDAIVIGEVWENASHYINGNMLDGAMNYDFRRYLSQYIAKETIDGEEFLARINGMFMRYPKQSVDAQLNLLDSHDVSRFLSLCDGNLEKLELALVLLMTMPGMPCVFYGDEQGLMGITEPEYRRPMTFGQPIDIFPKLICTRGTVINGSNSVPGGFISVPGGLLTVSGGYFGVYINPSKAPMPIEDVKGTPILQKKYDCGILNSMGYLITRM